jgi:TonB family protein
MNPLFIYLVKAVLCLAALYIVYQLFLCRDTMYERNRLFILFSLLLSLFLPLISIETREPMNMQFFSKNLTDVYITGNINSSAVTGEQYFKADLGKIALYVYITGILILGLKLLSETFILLILIIKNKKTSSNVIRLRNSRISAFSEFGHVFINSGLSKEDAEEIRKHEQNHLDHYHFLDIIFIEVIKIFQWFNPIIYLFDRSLRAIHEYQADEGCLKAGISVISYQKLIMKQIFRSKAFTATNSFSNPTLIKKRMIMMTKEPSRMMANLKLLLVLPVIAVVMIAFSSCKGKAEKTESTTEEIAPPPPPPPPSAESEKKVVTGEPAPADAPPPPPPPFEVSKGDTTWHVVDKMPVFPGGESALLQFIADNTKYPENAKTEGIQGRVVVRFAVENDRTIDRINILKGVDPELDAEAFRVVKLLPKFEQPGLVNNKPVAVWYIVPITFTLR